MDPVNAFDSGQHLIQVGKYLKQVGALFHAHDTKLIFIAKQNYHLIP
jgi:hypothetical protein